MNLLLYRHTAIAFSKIRWHRDYRSAQLITKRILLMLGKFLQQSIHAFHKFTSLLPCSQLFELELKFSHNLQVFDRKDSLYSLIFTRYSRSI